MRVILILIISFLFTNRSVSQTKPVISYLGIENGLSNNQVRSIYQDHKGFLWFGTRDGLNRYDGYGFKVFRNQISDPHSLTHNIISVIKEDIYHQLWIGTRRGVSVYNGLYGSFTTIHCHIGQSSKPVPINYVIKDIGTDRDGNVFIGAEELGLLHCKPNTFLAETIPLLVAGAEINHYGVQSIRTSKDGTLWVLVQNLGLCKLDYRSKKLILVNDSMPFTDCMEVNDNNIWLGTINGLFKYNIINKSLVQIIGENSLGYTGAILSMGIDQAKNVWLGTPDKGVLLYDVGKNTFSNVVLDPDKQLPIGVIYAVYIDKNSRKWIGTSLRGVSVVDPNKKGFSTISLKGGNSEAISSILEDTNNRLWIGTEYSGLDIWDRKTNTRINFKNKSDNPNSISANYVTSIQQDAKNRIWLATFSAGINLYDPVLNGFKRYKCINPITGIENKVAFALHKDRNQILWASTLRRGSLLGALYRFNPTLDKFELFDTRLSDLFDLYEDSKGDFWGGNLSQLVRIDKKAKNHKFFDIGYTLRTMLEDTKGNFWVGTEGGGLLLFDRKAGRIMARYTAENGLCNNAVLSILEDKGGNIWLSTYNGISKFNPTTKSFENFYQSDGLQSNQFQINAGLKLKSGEFAFGGIKGLNIFDPLSIFPINNFPSLQLTGVSINNLPIETSHNYVKKESDGVVKQLKVPYKDAIFSFEFTALEYSAANKISYSYFMEGWDRDWNKAGKNRTAVYTHIDEGSYVFRVRSTNADGVWSKKEIALNIIVLPPWYRTWLAYFFYFSLVVLAIYLYLFYKSRQTRLRYDVKIAKVDADLKRAEYERELAEYEKDRLVNEKEKELNEKRLTFFTNVSHEFRTPLTLIINPVKDLINSKSADKNDENKELNTIYRNAKRLLSLVDQLLLFRKSEIGLDAINNSKLNFYNLCTEVYLCFIQQANVKKIDYQFNCEQHLIEVYVDKEKIEIVLFNLLSNAIKYTPENGKVIFSITETDENVMASVVDTGHGIPDKEQEKIFNRFYQAKRNDNHAKPGFGIGLYLARHFTELHSGLLTFESEIGKGTKFLLSLPRLSVNSSIHLLPEHNEFKSELLSELITEDFELAEGTSIQDFDNENLISDRESILIVDDEQEIRQYIKDIFSEKYIVYEAGDGESGLKLAREKLPDLIITDYRMQGIDGIEFCEKIKEDVAFSSIPVILLTASSSPDLKLKSIVGGADDYINKPFEKDYLIARVANLLKKRNHLQNYFYNEITLQANPVTISEEYKNFLEKCIRIVESHLNDSDFGIQALSKEIGMSHSNLYKKVRAISGQSVTSFIRFIRLRKAAEMMINSDCNVTEVAFRTGFNDSKYFGKQFSKLFGINPSGFIKKHRNRFNKKYNVKQEFPGTKSDKT